VNGFRFSTELTARFSETDAQGIIHHGVHVIWFEIARIAYLEQVPGGYSGLVASGVDVTTIEMNIRYREAVRFGDRLRIWTRCAHARGARLRFEYAVVKDGSDGLAADGWTAHACVDATTLRATRVPKELTESLVKLES
jgi:acyl-CoA thioester hydrolase